MLTDFVIRNRQKIVSLFVSACLVACFCAESGNDNPDARVIADQGNSYAGLPDSEVFSEVRTETLYSHRLVRNTEAQMNGSVALNSGLAALKISSLNVQWPRQSAGSFRTVQSYDGVRTAQPMLEDAFAMRSSGSVARDCAFLKAPWGSESFGITALGQFRLQETHEYSPTSQGSMIVNF